MLRTTIGSALICASLAWAAPPPAKPAPAGLRKGP